MLKSNLEEEPTLRTASVQNCWRSIVRSHAVASMCEKVCQLQLHVPWSFCSKCGAPRFKHGPSLYILMQIHSILMNNLTVINNNNHTNNNTAAFNPGSCGRPRHQIRYQCGSTCQQGCSVLYARKRLESPSCKFAFVRGAAAARLH